MTQFSVKCYNNAMKKVATPQKDSSKSIIRTQEQDFICDIYLLSLVTQDLHEIFSLTYNGLLIITNNKIINLQYSKLRKLYSNIYSKYDNIEKFKQSNIYKNKIEIPEYLSDLDIYEAEVWWIDQNNSQQLSRLSEILSRELDNAISEYSDEKIIEDIKATGEVFLSLFGGRKVRSVIDVLIQEKAKATLMKFPPSVDSLGLIEILIEKDTGTVRRVDNNKAYKFRSPIKNSRRFRFLLKISSQNTPASELGDKNDYISNEIKEINKILKEKLNLRTKLIININNSGYEIDTNTYKVTLR